MPPSAAVRPVPVNDVSPTGQLTGRDFLGGPTVPLMRPMLGGPRGGFHYSPDAAPDAPALADTLVLATGHGGFTHAVGYTASPRPFDNVALPSLANPGDSGIFHKSGNKLVLTAGGVAITGPLSAGATSVASLSSAAGLSGASGGVTGAWSAGSLSAGSTSLGGTTVSSLTIGAGGPTLSNSGGVVSSGATLSVGGLTVSGTPVKLINTGFGPPSALALTAKLVLWGSPANDQIAYALGVDAGTLWYEANNWHRFYLGATAVLSVGTSASDPGTPWMRSDGNFLVVNPRDGADLYLMWDSSATAGRTHVGQNANAVLYVGEGAGTLLCGALTTGSGVLTVGAGGLFNNGNTQLQGTLGVSGLTSIQGLTTNGVVTHNGSNRLTFGTGPIADNSNNGNFGGATWKLLLINVAGVNYGIPLYSW